MHRGTLKLFLTGSREIATTVASWGISQKWCACGRSKNQPFCDAVQYELYEWVERESDEATAHDTIALVGESLIVPLTTEIAPMAADLSLSHKLAFSDAAIYAGARKHGVELVTSEDFFERLPGVT